MTKKEAKLWIYSNMLMGIMPKRSKYIMLAPFASIHGREQVVDHLAGRMSELFEDKAMELQMALAKKDEEILELKNRLGTYE